MPLHAAEGLFRDVLCPADRPLGRATECKIAWQDQCKIARHVTLIYDLHTL